MSDEFDISDGSTGAPPTGMMPQPPPSAAPGGESRYNSRVSRARKSNALSRSASMELLAENLGQGDGETGNPGAPIRPKLQMAPRPAPWSRGVADAMEAEIERADSVGMVRDITHAVLPTRASFQGRGSIPVQSRAALGALGEDDEDEQDFASAAPNAMLSNHSAIAQRSPPRRASASQPPAIDLRGPAASKAHPAGFQPDEEWSNDAYSEQQEDREATAIAMQAAITSNRADMVETLLQGDASQLRADPNCICRGGKRPLGLAAQQGLYDIAHTLVKHGADAALPDRNGDAPLHFAVMRNHLALARLLLEHGALPSTVDASGRTPLQLSTAGPMRDLLRAADQGESLPGRLPGEEEDDDDDNEESFRGSPDKGAGGGGSSQEGVGVLAPSKPNGAGGPAASANVLLAGKAGKKEQGGATADAEVSSPVPYGPPPVPAGRLGDVLMLPDKCPRDALIAELQKLLNSTETDLKRLLVVPSGLKHEVQCDVVRVGSGNTYRAYLRLGGRNDRRVCIFEASRTRKGKLKNSQYRIMLPSSDARMVPSAYGPIKEMSDEALDAALYCGKVRSYNLSGANFIAYDDGVKPEDQPKGAGAELRMRRQMVAMCFNKSTSRRVPMTMRMLLPTPNPAPDAPTPTGREAELLEALQAIPFESGHEQPPNGTQLLKLVPPRWNADEQMFQLFCEGRACCMSNKNVQLADTSRPDEAALQVGKLRSNMFNVDMNGCVSPFQAFASALAVFDQSSVRRRF